MALAACAGQQAPSAADVDRQPDELFAAPEPPPLPSNPREHHDDPAPAPVATDPLPAGSWYNVPGYDICAGCPRPGVAVVAGIHATAAEATKQLRRHRPGASAGYPFAAHTDELGLADEAEGIVVVLGLFLSVRDAEKLAADLPDSSDVSVVAVVTPEAWTGRMDALRAQAGNDGVGPTRAWIIDVDETPAFSRADYDERTGEIRAGATPICTLSRGEVFSAGYFDYYRWSWGYLPATCPTKKGGTTPALVHRWRTSADAVVIRRIDGSLSRSRLDSVMCDMADIIDEPYDPDTGPTPPAGGTLVAGGCGG